MKVLSNVKYQYLSFVKVVAMPSTDSNNVKYNIAILEFIRNKQLV